MTHKAGYMWYGGVGQVRIVKHCISFSLLTTGPWTMRRTTLEWKHKNLKMERDMIPWLKFIEPAQSELASCRVPEAKGDGSLEICADYQNFDAFTIRRNYRAIHLRKCIASPGYDWTSSSHSGKQGYEQMKIDEPNCEASNLAWKRRL